MTEYRAPLRDMQFVLKELAGLDEIAKLPGCEEVNSELVGQILEEAAKFASGVLSPLNKTADQEGSRWENGAVRTPKGFKQAYLQFVEGGWNAMQAPPEYGGQGLPKIVTTPVIEMFKSANLSFSLCPMLTAGAVEALLLRGSERLKNIYVKKMVGGAWTGTMNLTEPQAGSDLALVKTRAVRSHDDKNGDHYRIHGQKIFITYGEHDLAENIVHMVLARTPDAPEGVRGISMFVVPKFLVGKDGSPGLRNDVKCASIEHKLGIHASPTAVMIYGEKEGAVGYLVGEENRGLEYMFIMMNAARFAVGLEGVSISERAYQQALAYAKERIQSRDLAGGGSAVPIIRHPDVRRMLMNMKAQTEAMRALAYVVAAAMDKGMRHPDKEERARNQAFADLLIPIVKGWSTETGIEVASTGIQVHGGMGFIEETGAAQHLRDARITTIYEGTTGIQANDLVGRKIARDGEGGHEGDAQGRSGARSRGGSRCFDKLGAGHGHDPRGILRGAHRGGGMRFLDRHHLRQRHQGSARRRGALSQTDGYRLRRLADGARRARRQAKAGGREGRQIFLRSEDQDCAFLRGSRADPGAGVAKCDRAGLRGSDGAR